MVEKDDWRLLNDVEHLKSKYINPTDGEEISKHAPHLKSCSFCMEQVRNNPRNWWYVPEDISCCICEECFNDFKEIFEWKLLDGWDIVWDKNAEKEEIISQIAGKGLIRVVDETSWSNLVNAVITEMPFQPAFIIKYVTHPFTIKCCGDNSAIQGENFVADVSYWGNWNGENFPSKEYYYRIEWIKVRPRYLKPRGKLIKPEVIDVSKEFEDILNRYSIPYELRDGTYCIYGYKKV